MTKKAAAEKTVTTTSQPSQTIIRREGEPDIATSTAHTVAGHTMGQHVIPRADSPDANRPGQPQADGAHPDTPSATRAAGVSSHDVDQATLDQLNQQLATIRGLPQYADLERELTDRLATLSAPLVRE